MPRPAHKRKVKDDLTRLLEEAMSLPRPVKQPEDPWVFTRLVKICWTPPNSGPTIVLGIFRELCHNKMAARRLVRTGMNPETVSMMPEAADLAVEYVSGYWWIGEMRDTGYRPETPEELKALRARFDELIALVKPDA